MQLEIAVISQCSFPVTILDQQAKWQTIDQPVITRLGFPQCAVSSARSGNFVRQSPYPDSTLLVIDPLQPLEHLSRRAIRADDAKCRLTRCVRGEMLSECGTIIRVNDGGPPRHVGFEALEGLAEQLLSARHTASRELSSKEFGIAIVAVCELLAAMPIEQACAGKELW